MDKDVLYRFFEGTASPEELKKVREWSELSSENKKELFRERKIFDASNLLPSGEINIESDIESPVRFIRFKKIFREVVKVAAIVIITLLSAWFFQTRILPHGEQIAMNTIQVPAGQNVSLELSDGTKVWLNSRTKMKYPSEFSKNRREIMLDGEAYFEVSENKHKPFVVHTGKYNIEVLGTKFNVDAYSGEDEFSTSLMEGSVKLISISDTSQSILLYPNYMAYLKGGKLYSGPITDFDIYRWKEGLICFNTISFLDLMSQFEKCYGLTIVVENNKVRKYTCSGKFRMLDGIDYALKVLQRDVNFNYIRDEHSNIIYIR